MRKTQKPFVDAIGMRDAPMLNKGVSKIFDLIVVSAVSIAKCMNLFCIICHLAFRGARL